jgi:hypothetical protein
MLDTLKRSIQVYAYNLAVPGSGYMQIGILIMVPIFLVLVQ